MTTDPFTQPLDLDAIRARVDATASGPWHWEGGYPQRISNPQAVIIADTFTNPDHPAYDAEFIAAAREDIPALLAELATVTEQRDGHYAQFFDTQRELAAALTEVEQLRAQIASAHQAGRELAADVRAEVVAELVETLEGVYVGDPMSSLYTAGKKDGYMEAAGTVRHHYDEQED